MRGGLAPVRPRLSLDGSACQALDVVALQRQVEDHAGDHGDDGAGDQVAVVDLAGGAGLDVEQGDREGVLVKDRAVNTVTKSSLRFGELAVRLLPASLSRGKSGLGGGKITDCGE
jgi:hypothetical protein